MMMNQGGTPDTTITTLDPSLEKYPLVDSSQAYASSYYTTSTGSAVASWTTHRTDNYSMDNGLLSSSSYHHDQNAEPTMRNVQDGLNVAAGPSTSSSGLANVQQDYSNYASYSSNDSCGYNNAGYTGYYNGCQQQTSLPYSQPVGAYQSTGAPYQPLSSFQNTGSYAGPASYSSTYYNPADYQTSGGYPTGSYGSQTNLWHENNYTTYSSHPHPYTTYSTDSNGAYNSNAAAAPLTYNSNAAAAPSTQYQQHYKQWADYCNQTEASCAPGTENTVVSSAFNLGPSVPGVPVGYSASNNQSSATFSTSWRPEASTELHAYQPAAAVGGVHDNYWKHGAPVFQNHQIGTQQPNYQKPMDSNSTYETFQEQQKFMRPQGPHVQYPATSQVPQSYPSLLQTVPQTVPSVEMRRVSKLQIPTNPRIASNLALGLSKTDKDSSTNNAALKPAYISVSVPKSNDKVSSHDAADSVLKSSTFPKSLRGYVERALNRCKDDAQKAACQELMKEVIKKASADGTLFTRDWDAEPLFPLPTADVSKDPVFSTPVSSLSKSKRSPSRRSKSRWEPISEEKPVDQLSSGSQGFIKYGGRDTLFSGGKTENKESFNNMKFSLSDQKTTQRNVTRPAKRQRFGDVPTIADNGDASSDSDKEQSLTAYYSGAMALAESPEERKRRENRSKRFEKGSGNRAGNNSRPKNIGPGNLYTRRASAMVLSRNFEEGVSRAVEDIDWDAFTVKGTCQQIEKHYLRLTSAPDPTTVRPEEVLKNALDMVRTSQKNYLYKCDQLKSIRQDLTVQHIRNELTVKVYETHARFAIEVGDLPEYNQCQSQLTTLYAEGIKGCHMEFSAYNLLCVILHSNNNRDLLSAMLRLSAEAKKDEAVKHALAVRSAVTSGNYVLFFRLYKTAPNLNTCLMDLYVEKMRYAAVRSMSRSYRPTLPVSYVAQVLGFTSVLSTSEVSDEKDTDGMDECVEWLKAHGACLIMDNSGEQLFDAKASTSSLYMPEPEDAVAHGDASLAVNDFLTRNSL